MAMTLRLHFASLSLGASVDQQTGNLSVFDVIEEIRVPQLPIYASMAISVALEKMVPEPANGKMLIHFLTPDGKQAMVGSGDLMVPGEQKRLKAVFRLSGFPVTQFGEHRFVLSWVNAAGNKEGEALLDFDVIQVSPQGQPAKPLDLVPGGKSPITH